MVSNKRENFVPGLTVLFLSGRLTFTKHEKAASLYRATPIGGGFSLFTVPVKQMRQMRFAAYVSASLRFEKGAFYTERRKQMRRVRGPGLQLL